MRHFTWSILASAVLLGAVACNNDGSPSRTRGSTAVAQAPRAPAEPTSAPPPAPDPTTPATPAPTPTPTPEAPPVASPPPAPPAPKYAHVWVVSLTGDDAAAGTESSPVRTIGRALTLAGPGDLITVKSGTYAERLDIGPALRDGTPDAKIMLQGDGKPRLIPSGQGWAMVDVRRANWIIDGFELDAQGTEHAGVSFSGNVQGSVLSHCEVHGGTAGAAVTTSENARGVTIEDNHIHHYSRGDDDAHGVLVNPTSHDVTIRNNRIHDVSGDSVQCIGPEGYSEDPPATDVLIEGNDLSHNRENAVDIKTCSRVTVRKNVMHDFKDALPGGCLVVVHMSARDITIEDNELSGGGNGIAVGGNHVGPVPTNVIIRHNRIRDMIVGSTLDGTAIQLQNSEGAQVLDNTFAELQGPALMAGGGTGGATSHLTVQGNTFQAATAYKLGPEAPGLASRKNAFAPGAAFLTPSGKLDLAGWQKLGFDADAALAPAVN